MYIKKQKELPMEKNQEQLKKEQKETLKLIGILSVGVFVLLILSIVLMNNLTMPTVTPEPKYIDIDNIEGMNLDKAKTLLENADITYEIIPTESKIANKVEKLEFRACKRRVCGYYPKIFVRSFANNLAHVHLTVQKLLCRAL